jgi:hypothetical protein
VEVEEEAVEEFQRKPVDSLVLLTVSAIILLPLELPQHAVVESV